jgi:hypothetical protein
LPSPPEPELSLPEPFPELPLLPLPLPLLPPRPRQLGLPPPMKLLTMQAPVSKMSLAKVGLPSLEKN